MTDGQDILIILGAPNATDGSLSPMALRRADCALAEYGRRPGCKIVITGGWGRSFNTTDKPHAHYVAEYLRRRGVSDDDILPFAESSNTVQDAVYVRAILGDRPVRTLCVITSDFHCPRADYVFRAVFPGCDVVTLPAAAPLSPEERERRERHEAAAMKQLHDQGGVILPPAPGAQDRP